MGEVLAPRVSGQDNVYVHLSHCKLSLRDAAELPFAATIKSCHKQHRQNCTQCCRRIHHERLCRGGRRRLPWPAPTPNRHGIRTTASFASVPCRRRRRRGALSSAQVLVSEYDPAQYRPRLSEVLEVSLVLLECLFAAAVRQQLVPRVAFELGPAAVRLEVRAADIEAECKWGGGMGMWAPKRQHHIR